MANLFLFDVLAWIVRYAAAPDVSVATPGKSAGRAARHRLQWAFLDLPEDFFPMNVKRRRLINFESCSLALFASAAMGSAAVPQRAQAAPSTRSVTSTAPAAITGRTAARLKPRANTTNPRISPGQDPAASPDGSVSSPGFDEALK